MRGSEVPEPSEKLKGLYREIWTEVDENWQPKRALDGLPFNPRDHLMWVVSNRYTRSFLLDLFTSRNMRGTRGKAVPREVAEAYIDQLEQEAGVKLDP